MSQSNEKMNQPSRGNPDKSVVGKLTFVLLVAWVVAMVVNMVDWNTRGYTALMQKLDKNYTEKMEDVFVRNETISVYSDALIVLIEQYTKSFFMIVIQKVKSLLGSLNLLDVKSDKQTEKFMSMISQGAIQFLSVMAGTTQVLFAKVMSILASFWIYVFYSLVGILDGLVRRYIRTAEGGRESTFVFHKVSHIVIQLPVWILAVYWVVPNLLSPEIVAILISFALFAFFKIATSQLKKYL